MFHKIEAPTQDVAQGVYRDPHCGSIGRLIHLAFLFVWCLPNFTFAKGQSNVMAPNIKPSLLHIWVGFKALREGA